MEFEPDDLKKLEILIETEQLTGPAFGIGKIIVAEGGTANLSDKQLNVFKQFIEPELQRCCEVCGGLIESEQYYVGSLLCLADQNWEDRGK